MSPVRQALQKLEGSVSGLEKVLHGEQPDMFTPPSNENAVKAATTKVDPKAQLVAKKIDHAIEKVEALLQGG